MSQTDYFNYLYESHEFYKQELEKLKEENINLKESLDILYNALGKILKF